MAFLCKLKKRDGTLLSISSPKSIAQVQGTSGSLELEPEILYICGELASLSFSLNSIGDNGVAGEYHIMFQSGNTPTTVIYPSGLWYPDGVAPTIESNRKYEFHIVNNCLGYQSYAQL